MWSHLIVCLILLAKEDGDASKDVVLWGSGTLNRMKPSVALRSDGGVCGAEMLDDRAVVLCGFNGWLEPKNWFGPCVLGGCEDLPYCVDKPFWCS